MTTYQLVTKQGPGTGTPYPLVQESVLIGRDPTSDLRLDDPEVSRNHCRLNRRAGGGYQIQDLGSTNGTFLDGRRLKGTPEKLVPGQSVQLGGNVILRYEASNPDDVFKIASGEISPTVYSAPEKADDDNVAHRREDDDDDDRWNDGDDDDDDDDRWEDDDDDDRWEDDDDDDERWEDDDDDDDDDDRREYANRRSAAVPDTGRLQDRSPANPPDWMNDAPPADMGKHDPGRSSTAGPNDGFLSNFMGDIPEAHRRNYIILGVVIGLLVLCCCCLLIFALSLYMQIPAPELERGLRSMMII